MSVPPREGQLSFTHVPFLAEELLEPESPYRLFHDRVLPMLEQARGELEKLYCTSNGRPSIEPVVMAGATLLQFMEKSPDRQAVRQLRMNLGWKYALGLDVRYAGFDPSSLVNFRQRLVEAGKVKLLFDQVLQTLQEAGLVKTRGKQRLDSTHIVANVATMSRLEVVRETLRLVLEELARASRGEALPGWTQLQARYCDSEVAWHRQSKEQLAAAFRQAGADALAVLEAVRQQPDRFAATDKTRLLERVFAEQFEVAAGKLQVRPREESATVKNPHDPDAQWAAKDLARRKHWTGYKAQVMETVPQTEEPRDKGEPTEQFLTDVVTTEATASELEGLKQVERSQQASGQPMPTELYVDAAYVTGDTLFEAQQQERELIGPPRPSPDRKGILKAEDFQVDLANRRATCPAGRVSTQCSRKADRYHGREVYEFEWGAQCDNCAMQRRCTRSHTGRRELCVGEHHDLLQERRHLAQTEAFKLRMRSRNAIEGTISELARLGMRRTRYRGLLKTRLANYLYGAAVNIRRWLRLLAWRLRPAAATA
jgi:transposase